MAVTYPGDGILTGTFKVKQHKPLDDRLVVSSQEELVTIENPYIGMICAIYGEDSLWILKAPSLEEYTASSNKIQFWSQISGAGSDIPEGTLPVFTSENNASASNVSEYILAQPLETNATELPLIGSGGNVIYTSSATGNTYIDVLFETVKQLLAEVTKLKNSFKYGINSYCEDRTAISTENASIESTMDEPLWAIEEDTLNEIWEIDTDLKKNLFSGTSVEESGDTLIFRAKTEKTLGDNAFNLSSVTDPKQFTYITSTSLDVIFELKHEDKSILLNLNDLGYNYPQSLYNVLLIISKKVNDHGSNYIWVSVTNVNSEAEVYSGYYNAVHNTIETLEYTLEEPYYLSKITFGSNLSSGESITLSKLKLYSRYQDFSDQVIPTIPDDSEYKFEAAHITIRSVATPEILSKISNKVLEGELIFVKSDKTLRIKTSDKIIILNGSYNNPNEEQEDMAQIKETLEKYGIVTTTGNDVDGYNIHLNNIEGITMLDSKGVKHEIFINTDGELEVESENTPTLETLARQKNVYLGPLNMSGLPSDPNASLYKYQVIEGSSVPVQVNNKNYNYYASRSIISKILSGGDGAYNTGDKGLASDRLRIASFYVPLSTDAVKYCTHAYIELENSSNVDIPLNNCYIHAYRYNTETSAPEVYNLKLKGVCPAGSTYLIRAKQYARTEDANTIINVDSYDVEWKTPNGSLLDLTVDASSEHCYSFCLTYGFANLDASEEMIKNLATVQAEKLDFNISTINYYEKGDVELLSEDTSKINWIVCNRQYIDSCVYGGSSAVNNSKTEPCKWYAPGFGALQVNSNSIVKLTFELDPAKQAYNGICGTDSSRIRWAKNGTDIQYLKLEDYISFPKSDLIKYVADYTPKASYLHKNVITDKTKLNYKKPNAVTVSFGIDVYNTRCFNWVSAGLFDEYIWIRKQGETSWGTPVPSYTLCNEGDSYPTFSAYSGITRKEFCTKKEIVKEGGVIEYQVDDPEVNNKVYARITSTFPGADDIYTVHKSILTGFEIAEEKDPQVWEYVVGRAKNGKPEPEHTSEVQTFTVYPKDWEGKVYQITDQQGFHWVEYQVWTAAAKCLNEFIPDDLGEKEFPILINTGDMTQSGARINEWLDYYNGGYSLFSHMEQMNIIGNNDLCGPDPTVLGTGNDDGKSNPYYLHVFYCYEIENNKDLICNGKYIPSMYYIDTKGVRYLFFNSEITYAHCQKYLGLKEGNYTFNAYTGISFPDKVGDTVLSEKYYTDSALNGKFTPLYDVIYKWFASAGSKKLLSVFHEMPFTVITNGSLKNSKSENTRTFPDNTSKPSNSLGCHMNLIHPQETKGTYWISRLMEHFKCRLAIGGHKHTFALSQSLAENYKYTIGTNVKSSLNDGAMVMGTNLQSEIDNPVDWTCNSTKYTDVSNDGGWNYSTTKLPLLALDTAQNETKLNSIRNTLKNNDQYLSCRLVLSSSVDPEWSPEGTDEEKQQRWQSIKDRSVTYFMCQATGYKVISNKELPSAYQMFSYIIPQTNFTDGADTVNTNQLYPMFGIISNVDSGFDVKLGRIENIVITNPKNITFAQGNYNKNDILIEYLIPDNTRTDHLAQYGKWTPTLTNIVEIR